MKKTLLSLFALSFYVCLLAQAKKFEVICEVYNSQISYYGIDKVLPDSVKGYFVKLDRNSGLGNLGVVNFLCVNGWTLVSCCDRSSQGTVSSPVYVLKRKFLFSDKDYQVVINRLNDWMKNYPEKIHPKQIRLWLCG